LIVKGFTAQWFRSEIDLRELAKLLKAGWTPRALAAHFVISKSSIVDRELIQSSQASRWPEAPLLPMRRQ